MSESTETVTDIVAELRGYAHGYGDSMRLPMSFGTFHRYIDRIEKAATQEGRSKKNKDRFDNYDIAYATYHGEIVPKFGATRMEWGFGRWLWMEHIEGELPYWMAMDALGILTGAGHKMLTRAIKAARAASEKAEKEAAK